MVPFGIEKTARNLRYANVATIVNDADAFSRSNNEKVTEVLDAYEGISIVSQQSYSRSSNADFPDLTEQLNAIKRDSTPPPEVLFISALQPGRVGVTVQARRLGMNNIRFFYTLLTLDDVEKAEAEVPGSTEGAISFTYWIADMQTPGNREFVENYKESYGEEPDAHAAAAYVSVHVLAAAIAGASTTDSQAIRDAMAAVETDTIFGEFSFDQNGDAVYAPAVGVVRDGRFEVFE